MQRSRCKKKMKKKPMQIIMVCFAVVAMILINVFELNISSLMLMLVSAVIGIVVFSFKSNLERARVKK